jgi:hypothetical protein
MIKFSVFFFVLIPLCATRAAGQQPGGISAIDTLYLPEIKFVKTLAYSTGSTTILIDYNSFMVTFNSFWKMYKKGMRGLRRSEKKGEYVNPNYAPIFYLLDSMHTVLTTQVKQQDTVYIDEYTFLRKGIGPGHDFSVDVDARKCVILNGNNVPQRRIIRKKESYQRGPLNGWGGRKYYFLNSKTVFLSATDWVS